MCVCVCVGVGVHGVGVAVLCNVPLKIAHQTSKVLEDIYSFRSQPNEKKITK